METTGGVKYPPPPKVTAMPVTIPHLSIPNSNTDVAIHTFVGA